MSAKKPVVHSEARPRQTRMDVHGVRRRATTVPTTKNTEVYDATEQDVIAREFGRMLREVTKDGGRKRAAGTKLPWWKDSSHEAAIFSHINKWKHGEKADKDSGQHPLVNCAWRCLAIAYQETHGQVDPEQR